MKSIMINYPIHLQVHSAVCNAFPPLLCSYSFFGDPTNKQQTPGFWNWKGMFATFDDQTFFYVPNRGFRACALASRSKIFLYSCIIGVCLLCISNPQRGASVKKVLEICTQGLLVSAGMYLANALWCCVIKQRRTHMPYELSGHNENQIAV